MALKKQVISGVIWTASEKLGSMLVQIGVQILLMRMLEPSLFGLMAILTAFATISSSIVDSGFSQALIQKQHTGHKDYNSVFLLNIVVSIALYFALFGLSRPIARFYEIPELARLAPIIFCILPINAISLIHVTILTKRMDFKRLSKTNFTASAVAGTVAVGMAAAGYGIWALAANLITLYAVRSAMLWTQSDWRPTTEFSMDSIRKLFGLGSKLFATGLITQIFNNFSQLVLGKTYKFTQTGFYDRSLKYKDLIASSVIIPIQGVTFPAFATLQDNDEKLKQASRKVVKMLAFSLFPIMAGLIAIADEMFFIVFKEKWMPAVPYFKTLCLSAIFMPLTNIAQNIFKAKGQGTLILTLEIVKKGFALAAILYAASISVNAVAWAYFIWMGFEMSLNQIFARRVIGYSFKEQATDTLPYAGITAIMYGVILLTGYLMPNISLLFTLLIKVAVGMVVYIAVSWLFKPEAWKDSVQIIQDLWSKVFPNKH